MLRAADRASLATDLIAAVRALRAELAAGLEITGREVPFVLALPRGTPRVFLHGRIDVIARRNGSWVVRDYKYARVSDAAVESYAAQLAAYRLAVSAAERVDVEAELVFVRGGSAVRRVAPADATGEEAALVRAAMQLWHALSSGAVAAFPRRPPAPAACETLGCGYVRRCWRGEATADAFLAEAPRWDVIG